MAFQATRALVGHYYSNMTLHPEPSITANEFCIIWPKILKREGRKLNKTKKHQLHHTSRV